MKSIIVAYDQNRAIGYQQSLPWQGLMPEDMKYFRDKTNGKAVIMGRKTYEAIGKPLPNRLNVVLTRKKLQYPGVDVVATIEEAYKRASHYEECFVIGGGEIYQLALPTIDRIYATEIGLAAQNADAYFPEIDPRVWHKISSEAHPADENNMYSYSFIIYERY